ncbi:MAG: GDP-mannose 4,6-dehydratase [Vicinamibacterales bacterium]
MNERVLVTGASGFAGSHLVELLAARGPVYAWSRSAPPKDFAHLATWQRVDLLDRAAVREAIADIRPTSVFHCAGSPHVAQSWHDTATPFSSNVIATHHLLEALGAADCGTRVLISGSATIYAPSPVPIDEAHAIAPASPYALSKLAQEQLGIRAIAEDGLDVVLTRSFNHTGPRQTTAFAAPSMARQIALIERGAIEPVIKVGNLDARRDFTDVRDVVRAYVQLVERGKTGAVYNVASGVAHTIRSVLDGLIELSRVDVRVEPDPGRLRPHDIPVLVGNAGRLRAATGWTPELTFEQMLADLLGYWRKAVV